ncbi:unnamed protein product [Phytomonas sp. EM1]|nr:unnamed protein product [Phytomonas sp. EM1]|eukprot:CCW62577.1 unnamed protein product [Phytomonas sp. isolate EM1]
MTLDSSSPPQPQDSLYTWNNILFERWLAGMPKGCLPEASQQRLHNAVGLFPLPIFHFPSAALLLDGGEEALSLSSAASKTTSKHLDASLSVGDETKDETIAANDVSTVVAPLAASPFGFASTAAFHNRLREKVDGGNMRAVVERRCHGFSCEGEFPTISTSSRAGPNTGSVQVQRKRLRQPSSPKLFQTELQPGGLDLRTRGGSAKSNMRTPIAGDQRQDPRPHTVGPLATRIKENDDVLSELLLGDVSISSVADTSPLPSQLHSSSAATTAVCQKPVTASGIPQTLPLSFNSETLNGLRSRCAANGLLTSGTKSDLYHRLMLFQERQERDLCVQPPRQPTNMTLPSSVASPISGGYSTGPPEKRSPSPSPPPRFPSFSHPSDASSDLPQLREISNGLISAGREGLSLSLSSPPPKRTVFRYRSGISEPLPSNDEAGGTSLGLGDLENTWGPKLSVSSRDAAIPERGLPPCRHVVPTPDLFIKELLNDSERSARLRPLARDKTKKLGILPGEAMSPGGSTAGKPVVTEAPKWQWLVDTRERVRGKHESMLALLERQHVSCASCMLPCGDFMLNVDVGACRAEGNVSQYQCSGFLQSSNTTNANDNTASAVQQDSTQPMSLQSLPLYPHLCSFVVERKTAADLDASIKSTRYLEQRHLLIQSRFQLVVWLIEGSEISTGRGHRSNGASRTVNAGNSHLSHTQPPLQRANRQSDNEGVSEEGIECGLIDKRDGPCGIEAAFSSLVPEGQRRVHSACMSLSHQIGFCVVRTRTVQESVTFLKQLGAAMAQQVASTLAMGSPLVPSNFCTIPRLPYSKRAIDDTEPSHSSFPSLLPTMACLRRLQKLQKSLRAETAFPRMLMCIRGCSFALAQTLFNKYGSFYGLWRVLQERGALACDMDDDIVKLSVPQRKVFVLLSEFLMAKEYF